MGLMTMAIFIEYDLTSNALSLALCAHSKNDREDLAEIFLQKMIDGNAAWKETLTGMGIDPNAMAKLCRSLRHPFVDCFLRVEADSEIALPPNEDAVKAQRQGMEDFFKKIQDV